MLRAGETISVLAEATGVVPGGKEEPSRMRSNVTLEYVGGRRRRQAARHASRRMRDGVCRRRVSMRKEKERQQRLCHGQAGTAGGGRGRLKRFERARCYTHPSTALITPPPIMQAENA